LLCKIHRGLFFCPIIQIFFLTTIPPEKAIITFLVSPSPNYEADMEKTVAPSAPALHTRPEAQKLKPRTSHTGGQGHTPGGQRH
jgi:hypothetical protein